MLPALLLLGPVLVHLGSALIWCGQGVRLHVFFQMLGSLALLFFIAFCTAALEPFQCQPHPNGSSTMASNIGALCNFTGEHFDLCLIGGLLAILPAGFLTLALWVIRELPRRRLAADERFVRTFSFMVLRFRPGCEAFAVFNMVRNAMFAFAPVIPLPSASLLLIYVLLYATAVVVVLVRPWRFSWAAYTEVLLCGVFLVVLFQGTFLVPQTGADSGPPMVMCSIAIGLLLPGLALISLASVVQHVRHKYRKQFHFFLSHQKKASGSLARLLKMELREAFLDADNLTDLTQLLPILTEQVETLVLLASPSVLTRNL